MGELLDILKQGCTAAWQSQMVIQGFNPVDQDANVLVELCECLKRTEEFKKDLQMEVTENSSSGKKRGTSLAKATERNRGK